MISRLLQQEMVTGVVCGIVISTAATLLIPMLLGSKKVSKKVDPATVDLLTLWDQCPKPLQAVSNLLLSLSIVDNEAACAEQLRTVIKSKYLMYSSLATDPELLLELSKYCGKGELNGALWTRFTVQFNLYAGSVVAMGTDSQRETLYRTQDGGALGCFAFTECGAGVLSGAVVETTAVYDAKTGRFTIHSPTESSRKKWISQGMFAEYAVICANLMLENGTKNAGPHLFFARIQNRDPTTGAMTPLPGVTVTSLNKKTALLGLDNAFVAFEHFQVDHACLLSRFSSIDQATGAYSLHLPPGVNRMLDLLISRLLTGRICLSEATVNYALALMRRSWDFASERELWRGKKSKGQLISELPLMRAAFVDYSRALRVVSYFIEDSRGKVARCIREDNFTYEAVEAACISKFVGTSFAVDAISVLRKLLGSQALYAESFLGASSFVANATCAAEGDNTIMELKVVQDMFRGRTPLVPVGLLLRSLMHADGRRVVWAYLTKVGYAMMLREKALQEGQLLKDIAWCRAHMLIMDVWRKQGHADRLVMSTSGEDNGEGVQSRNPVPVEKFLCSYESILVHFPMPVQC